MKKIALLSLILVAGLTLTGCLFKKSATPAATPAAAPEAAAPTNESFSGTLGELLAKGKAVKCTSASETNSVKTETEFYIDGANERSRNIAKITAAAKPTETTNSLMTKEAVYTWIEGQKEGFLYPITKTEPTPTAAEPSPVDQNLPAVERDETKYDFNCEAWKVDENIFALPEGVNFVDQAAKLKELMKNIPAVPSVK